MRSVQLALRYFFQHDSFMTLSPRSLLLFLSFAPAIPAIGNPSNIAELRQAFDQPPDDSRIMMRWWWFGSAVTKPELEREMRLMKDGGIGGFEVQPVYPLALDDPSRGFRNLPYLSDEFLDALRFTAEKAHDLGLRMNVTLGSGWPFGGPHVAVTEAAGMLRSERVLVSANDVSVPVPDIEAGEKLLAVFLAHGDRKQFAPAGLRRITGIDNGRIRLPKDLNGSNVVLFFIAGRTGMMVKRPAVGADGFVLDHYDRAAIESHLKLVADRLMAALRVHPPYSVFSDSLEVFRSDWTGDLIEEFHKRRGYDLTPYLPALIGDIGDKTAAVRRDWGLTLSELADERYLTPLREWAGQHGTLFRSQTYGTPPVTLSSNALVDLPEGEGPHWRAFSASRWAASASHLYGKPVTSSETWTWLHSPAFRATPLDMKVEADMHFLQGINQFVGHGWPYSPKMAGHPGWRFYAAAVFNEHNPWWNVMPDVARYFQRISFLLRQGKPANDVAVYLPTDDARAQFTAGKDSVDRSMDSLIGPVVIPQILDAGYNFDFIDDAAIDRVGIPYRVLIVPGVERIPLSSYRNIEAYARKGGIVVATRRLPALAPGLAEAETVTPQIRELSKTLFEAPSSPGHFIRNEQSLGKELANLLQPDLQVATGAAELGFVHRKLDFSDVYFIANTSNHAIRTPATFRITGLEPEWWNPFTGKASAAVDGTASQRGGTTIALELEPYESRVLMFSHQKLARPPQPGHASRVEPIDLSSDWNVGFAQTGRRVLMKQLHSWTEDEATKYYSGEATYERTISLPSSVLQAASELLLDFGAGTPVLPGPQDKQGVRAWLESPVREAAVVYVNDQRAGSVWRPPYELDVTKLLHAGENRIRVVVGNLAINDLAGQSLPDYKLLNSRYGVRFTPQDMENLKPLPAGLMGPVRLVGR